MDHSEREAARVPPQILFNDTLTYYYSEDAWQKCKFFQDTVRSAHCGIIVWRPVSVYVY